MNSEKKLSYKKIALWARILLGILAVVIMGTTLPAYVDTANNPALAHLSGKVASIGSVAGAFLGRQLTITLIALFGAWNGTRLAVALGAFGIFFFNLHDALLLGFIGANAAGAIAGLIIALLAAVVIFKAIKS